MTVIFELGVRRIDQHGGYLSSYSIESNTSTNGKQKDCDLCGGIGSTPHLDCLLINYLLYAGIMRFKQRFTSIKQTP